MNNENHLSILTKKRIKNTSQVTTIVVNGLTPYSGSWGFDQSAHLLRRAMFGPSRIQIERAVNEGLDATIDRLLDDSVLPTEGPINPGKWYDKGGVFFKLDDSNIPTGTPWVFKSNGTWKVGYVEGNSDNDALINKSRNVTLRNWKLVKY